MKRAGRQAPAKQNVTFAESGGKGWSGAEKNQQASPRDLHALQAIERIPWNSARSRWQAGLMTAACFLLSVMSSNAPPLTMPDTRSRQ